MNSIESKIYLVTDCGSTTSKALLFSYTDKGWIVAARGEAPTTVEEPVADVTVGVMNSFLEIQEISGSSIVLEKPTESKATTVPYLSTSSAGGGLQMVVTGVSKSITGRSAERAALGAGAIVLETLCADDGCADYERIERLRQIKPDIILISGGTDGGAVEPLLEMVEAIHSAAPKPRFGDTLKLPILYAGNTSCFDEVQRLLSSFAAVTRVSNIRSSVESEDLKEARHAIHEIFLSHVMSHSPGYEKLLRWVSHPILPTPTAVGEILFPYAEERNLSVLCADIGGATTDVFSTIIGPDGTFLKNRTVSANLGMSYSIGNVLLEAGIENILRWLPYSISGEHARERIRNKMIRPTSIPQTKEDLWLEQAVCREALRLSLDHHDALIKNISAGKRKRGIGDVFSQNEEKDGFSRMAVELVIGSGGVLSHAPSRLQAALMMLEGFALEGFTELCVDSIFMMPHLGVFAQVEKEGAFELFEKECLVRIAHAVVPVFPQNLNLQKLASISFNGKEEGVVEFGKVTQVRLPVGAHGELEVRPLSSRINVGVGNGQVLRKNIIVNGEGLLLDGRNRPIILPTAEDFRVEHFSGIYKTLGFIS